ncbi:alpha/beta hydrolase [Candidatus Chloroploca sp. M-50]|uniref:Alpha/beta hydrolase n=1 Tax=Candidatus Chloroploca mongolica TaxID=2528176 RepID=A0ABS4D4Y6_9CHLR|nr:alpha/beta fold hydrolase [Candidatus Chloroploca mongolica]MBP1464498.1 alpha/beta hydrolase [Candidatus Chloroploca mongolica]
MHTLEHICMQPVTQRYASPLLLLHGAWHGAWCWHEAMRDLAARGFLVHAFSTRGHGASDRPRRHWLTTASDYGRDLINVVRALPAPPILVGHSSGGYLAQLYMTGRFGPVPPLAGVVLLCSSPVDSVRYFLTRTTPPEAQIDPRAMLRREPETMRKLLFRPEIDPEALHGYVAQMVAEPPLVTMQSMVLRPRPARNATPVVVIAAGRDMVFGLEAQQVTAATYRAELIVVPEAAHDLMLDPDWPQAAAAIERFAQMLPS